MKLILSAIIVVFSFNAFAGELETQIRCTGKTSKGNQAGIDVKIDMADRLMSMAIFELNAVSVEDVSQLGAPSVYLQLDQNGNVAVFGLKTFNDGLETNNNVLFVAGASKMSKLELGYRGSIKGISNIFCEVLK